MICEALTKGFNSGKLCPDCNSFKLLKFFTNLIIYPLTIIFQHSFHERIFLKVWKHAIAILILKGCYDRGFPSLCRPISLCNCLGKELEGVALNKFSILHCGHQLQPINYSTHGTVIKSIDTLTDLGVIRLSDSSQAVHYKPKQERP